MVGGLVTQFEAQIKHEEKESSMDMKNNMHIVTVVNKFFFFFYINNAFPSFRYDAHNG